MATNGRSPFDVDYDVARAWDAEQVEVYCRLLLMTLDGYLEAGSWGRHSYALYRAFDEVERAAGGIYQLDGSDNFSDSVRRAAEIASQKILMEDARRLKTGAQSAVVLDAPARQAIHALINAIREKLNALTLPDSKRDSLFDKLNIFAAEVDRNRTRPEAFFAFAVEAARAGRQVADEIKPLQETIDRILDWIDKAKKWTESLPPWSERKQIEAPPKRLPRPQDKLDDDIPF